MHGLKEKKTFYPPVKKTQNSTASLYRKETLLKGVRALTDENKWSNGINQI